MRFEWSTTTSRLLHERANDYLFELYHENSKLFPQLAYEQAAQLSISPFELYLTSRGFRQYRGAPCSELPDIIPSAEPLSETMLRRRSSRDLGGAISLPELGTLLRQSLGPTAIASTKENGIEQVLRSWPSAGGLYPLDTYLIVSNAQEVPSGLYHYNVIRNALEHLPSRAPEAILRDGFFWQDFICSSAVAVLLVAVFGRTVAKYGERGYRLVLLDAGHAAQNLLLTAEQLHLGAVAVAGFCDDSLATDLHIDGVSEAVVHTIMLGKASQSDLEQTHE